MYSVYIIRSERSGRYYIGQTQDMEVRLRRHNSGGCDATRNKGPWAVVYVREYATRSEAVQGELHLKRMKSRIAIERLIDSAG